MKWGFIYVVDEPGFDAAGPGEPGASSRVDLIGTLVCVGVPNIAAAPEVARQLVAEGVELIELCGGFGAPGLAAVLAAVEGRIPVGAVFYGIEARAGLQRLFG